MRTLSLFALLLAVACAPAPTDADPSTATKPLTASDPLELDPTPRFGLALTGSLELKVANDGQNFLVAWVEQRGAVPEVYQSRVSQAGVLLDPTSVRVSRVSTGANLFGLAAGGGKELLTWQDPTAFVVTATRGSLGPIGQVPTSFDILPPAQSIGSELLPAWDGTAFDVALTRANPPELAFLRVFPDGGSSAATTIYPASPSTIHLVTGLAMSGGIAGVSSIEWLPAGGNLHHLTLVDPGTGGALAKLAIAQGQSSVNQLASDQSGFVLAWDDQVGTQTHVKIVRIAADGGVPFDGGSDVSPGAGSEKPQALSILPNGNIAVAYARPPYVGVRELSEDAGSFSVANDTLAADAGFGLLSSMSCIGPTCFLAWYVSGFSLFGAIYTQGGTLQAPFALRQNSRSQWSPKAAFAQDRYLVVWAETDKITEEFYGRLVDENGAPLSPPLLLFTSGATAPFYGSLDVVELGGRFVVLYGQGQVQGRFVELDGGVGGPVVLMPPTTGVGVGGLSAASAGDLALVAWSTFSSANGWGVRAGRLAADGTVLDSDGIPVADGGGPFEQPLVSVSRGERGFQVAWMSSPNWGNTTPLQTVSVSADDGGVSPILTLATVNGSQSQTSPELGFDGVHHSLTWVDGSGGLPELRLLQFDEDGGVSIDGGERVSAAGTVATQGDLDCRPGDCTAFFSERAADAYELRALQLSSDGGRKSFGNSLVTQADDELLPSAAAGDGGWILTWARYHAEAPYGSLRAVSRVIDGPQSLLSDAGLFDGGDSGGGDGGADAGNPDAGTPAVPERLHLRVGCGCDAAPGVNALFLAVGLLALRARRRRYDRFSRADRSVV